MLRKHEIKIALAKNEKSTLVSRITMNEEEDRTKNVQQSAQYAQADTQHTHTHRPTTNNNKIL